MDTRAEFTSLVAAHHRLMAKYGRGGRWNANTSGHRVSNEQEGFIGEQVIADGAPWIQPSLTTQRLATHRAVDVLKTTCCPRCNLRIGTKPFEVMSLPESYTGSDCGDKMPSPGLRSNGTTGGSGSIYLQLASIEYARLLAALNIGNRTLSSLIPDTLAAVQPYTTTYTGAVFQGGQFLTVLFARGLCGANVIFSNKEKAVGERRRCPADDRSEENASGVDRRTASKICRCY